MMKDALRDISENLRALVRNWQAMLLFFATYIALLASIGLFVTTREATIRQVLLSFALLVAAPALFFLLQAMCVGYAETTSAVALLKRSLKGFWKLMLFSIPVMLIALAVYLLMGKMEASMAQTGDAAGAQWPRVIFSTVRLLLFGFVMPLGFVHLWIALMREDVRAVMRGIGTILRRAFAPRSVVTYAFGFVLFGLLPYVLLNTRTPVGREWLELSLLIARVGLALCLMLLGWAVTVGALQKGMRSEEA
ncbi:MAG: hypothetical protein H7Y30_01150 [Pyrinomonadaceae bacterium]|nr:hypothetical protein [Pyrinomonadaceae bacterium]